MKLYITDASPYARIARIVILEKGLQDRVETIIAKTRTTDSPYYRINPSGRVPYLVRDDGVGMEESALICEYLDHIDGEPAFDSPAGEARWEARRLEALARSMVDGIAVWYREVRRPQDEQSPKIVQHEADRAARFADLWEREISHPLMRGPLNMQQITLACAFGLESRLPAFRSRTRHAALSDWLDRMAERPSLAATSPKPSTEQPRAIS
jgi:glutathione S-transferase